MIAYSYIEQNLRKIDSRYAKARDPKELSFLSKIAVIELCGWIEMSMDDICYRFINRNVKESKLRDELRSKIDKYYGFHYEKNFKKMIIDCVGFKGFSEILELVDKVTDQQFKSELGSLTTLRNAIAHTYVKGVTQNYDSPAKILSRFIFHSTGKTSVFRRKKALAVLLARP
jgi:RiboL-PSP-HEPN